MFLDLRATSDKLSTSLTGWQRGSKNISEGMAIPLQYSCLENPIDRGVWWATVHGVAKSRTRLKRLSMHAQSMCLEIIIYGSHLWSYSLCFWGQSWLYIFCLLEMCSNFLKCSVCHTIDVFLKGWVWILYLCKEMCGELGPKSASPSQGWV